MKGSADEALQVRISRHGPIVSDVVRGALTLTPRGHAMAFAWTALAEDDRTMQAAIRIGRSRSWQEFEVGAARSARAAADGYLCRRRRQHRLPRGGTRAGAQAGERPQRARPGTGLGRALRLDGLPGLRGAAAWLNPAGGAIVSANQKVTPAGFPHHITYEWQAPYRAARAEVAAAAHKAIASDPCAHADGCRFPRRARALPPPFDAAEGRCGAKR